MCRLRFLLLVVAIAVELVLLLTSCYYFNPYLLSDGSVVRPYVYDTSSRNCSGVSKWVVTTSGAITPPEAVHVILNSTEDWCVLVLGQVAGLKYDFSWTNGSTHLIYLPREALLLLPYKLATLTSLDIRNIGHLYAIANGARVVLDLEDGIVPIRVGHTYLPLQADKREFPCPNLEEKEVTGHITESPSKWSERPLYTKSSQVVNLLKYHLMSFERFEEALLGIYELMYHSQILGKDDLTLVKHWIKDLKLVGYEFPKLPNKATLWTKNVHLCIMFNWGSTEYRTRQLLSYYMRFFNAITLFLEGKHVNRNYIPSHIQVFHVQTGNGFFQQRCIEKCINQIAPNTVSHLYIADDMFINITKMSQLSLSKIWFIPVSVYKFGDTSTFHDWPWWDYSHGGQTQYNRFVALINGLPQEWKQVLIDKMGFPNRIHGNAVADIVHIPSAYAVQVSRVLNYINSVTEMFCEIAVPLAVTIAQPIGREEIGDGYVWDRRTDTDVIQNILGTGFYLHPLKTSTKFGADMWHKSMNNQLRLLI
eukprot:Em0203g2a